MSWGILDLSDFFRNYCEDILWGEYESCDECLSHNCGMCDLEIRADDLRNAATEVMAVKHGRWEVGYAEYGVVVHRCSLCGHTISTHEDSNYCPNCGARMDGGERKENDVYCDRNLCAQNEYNGIECDECQKMRKDEAEA